MAMKGLGYPTRKSEMTIEQSKRANGLIVRRATIEEAAVLVEKMAADPDNLATPKAIAAAIRAMPVIEI